MFMPPIPRSGAGRSPATRAASSYWVKRVLELALGRELMARAQRSLVSGKEVVHCRYLRPYRYDALGGR